MRAALLLATAAALAAQDTRFAVRSRLVIVPVNVFDADGHAVPALDAGDFTVLDNERPQKIAVDSIDTGVAPIALAIVVETAGVSRAAIEHIRQIGAMIQPLVSGERGYAGLVTFDERVTWMEDCTKDADILVRGFLRLRVSERQTKARLLDAASSAIDHLARRENVRRVLLLISETRDRDSETKADAVIAAAQLAGVAIYALPYSALATAFASKAPLGEQKPASTPTTPSEAYGTPNGQPPTKLNPRVLPPEQRIDYIGAIREAAHMTRTSPTPSPRVPAAPNFLSSNKKASRLLFASSARTSIRSTSSPSCPITPNPNTMSWRCGLSAGKPRGCAPAPATGRPTEAGNAVGSGQTE